MILDITLTSSLFVWRWISDLVTANKNDLVSNFYACDEFDLWNVEQLCSISSISLFNLNVKKNKNSFLKWRISELILLRNASAAVLTVLLFA